MPPILLLVPVLELLGLLGFIHLASTSVGPSLRYLPLVVAAVTVVLLITREAASMTLRQLAVSAALLSLAAVTGFQVLGFVFSGIAKDVGPISLANVVRLAVLLAIAMVAHGSALAVCHYLGRRRR